VQVLLRQLSQSFVPRSGELGESNLARVRVPLSSGTQSSIEAIAAWKTLECK